MDHKIQTDTHTQLATCLRAGEAVCRGFRFLSGAENSGSSITPAAHGQDGGMKKRREEDGGRKMDWIWEEEGKRAIKEERECSS